MERTVGIKGIWPEKIWFALAIILAALTLAADAADMNIDGVSAAQETITLSYSFTFHPMQPLM